MKKRISMVLSIPLFLSLYGCVPITDGNFSFVSPENISNQGSMTHMDSGGDNMELNMLYKNNSKKNDQQKSFECNKWYKPFPQSEGYKNMSSKVQISCYNSILKNCYKISDSQESSGNYPIESISIPNCRITTSEIKKVLYAVLNDHPEIFWLSNTFNILRSSNSTTIKFYSVLSPVDFSKSYDKLNKKISFIISNLNREWSEYERELYLHDYLVENCKYEKSSETWKHFTSYGALVDGNAVCEGYSKAFQLLMCYAGINCRTITGSSKNEAHMWNIAQIDNSWYHIDVTWDGIDNLHKYDYFNVTTNIIKVDHNIDPEFSEKMNFNYNPKYNFRIPDCNSESENYFNKNSVRITSLSDNFDNTVLERLNYMYKKRYRYISIIFDKSMDYDSTVKQMFTTQPYKFMYCIQKFNSSVSCPKIDSKVCYSENKAQRVITAEINYI